MTTDTDKLAERPERFQLSGSWSLRKLKLVDRSEWALQYLGMDLVRICEFLPQVPPGNALDLEIEKFSQAIQATALSSPPAQSDSDRRTELADWKHAAGVEAELRREVLKRAKKAEAVSKILRRALEQAKTALFPSDEARSDGSFADHSVDGNLESVIIDLEARGADATCLSTLNAILKQLYDARAALASGGTDEH